MAIVGSVIAPTLLNDDKPEMEPVSTEPKLEPREGRYSGNRQRSTGVDRSRGVYGAVAAAVQKADSAYHRDNPTRYLGNRPANSNPPREDLTAKNKALFEKEKERIGPTRKGVDYEGVMGPMVDNPWFASQSRRSGGWRSEDEDIIEDRPEGYEKALTPEEAWAFRADKGQYMNGSFSAGRRHLGEYTKIPLALLKEWWEGDIPEEYKDWKPAERESYLPQRQRPNLPPRPDLNIKTPFDPEEEYQPRDRWTFGS